MNLLTLLGLSVGLAMDAFAVSIGIGLNARHVSARTTVCLAWPCAGLGAAIVGRGLGR